MIIEQIKAQLSRLVPVHKIHDLTDEGPFVEREMALIKVAGKGESRIESLRLADIFRARVVDSTTESFVFEMTGSSEKLNAFITLMEPLGLVEISRTGAAAISRGPRAFKLTSPAKAGGSSGRGSRPPPEMTGERRAKCACITTGMPM